MITADTLLDIPLLASVPLHERETIASRAADVHLGENEWMIREGEAPSFFMLLSGRLDVRKRLGDEETSINSYDPGDFFGEVPLLLNSASVASVRAIEPSRVARLDGFDFRELIVSCEHLRERIVRTMVERVGALQRIAVATAPAAVTIIGHRYDLECHDVRDFLARNHVPFHWLDPDDAATDANVPAGAHGAAYPLVIFPGGTFLSQPTSRAIAEALKLQTTAVPGELYDVVIIGAGPAGLAAGVYGASEGLHTLLVERDAPGGQAGSSSRIENYLGFPTGLSGDELSTRAWEQAKRFGASMLSARDVAGIEPGSAGKPHHVILDDGERLATKAIVVATGVRWRTLDAPGVAALTGRGVYYGAARTEALETRGRDAYLVGGGNSAGQAAMYFSNYANSVTLIIRAGSLQKSMSQYLIDQLATKSNVHVQSDSAVVEAQGSDRLESIVVANTRTGERHTYDTNALFVLIGADADTAKLPASIVRDVDGYLCTGRDVLDLENVTNRHWPLDRDPYLLETSVPGIFAAGDVRHGSIKRVASGVGEGSMSIAFIHRYLDEIAAPAGLETTA